MGMSGKKFPQRGQTRREKLKSMDKIILTKITKKDITLIKQWLEDDFFKKNYKQIDQLRNYVNGEDGYIKYFIINNHSRKIGICQCYDCFLAQKCCDNIDKENIRYSIDYLILSRYNSDNDVKVIKKILDKIKKQNGKEIIIEDLGIKSLARLVLGLGFQCDREKIYKIL